MNITSMIFTLAKCQPPPQNVQIIAGLLIMFVIVPLVVIVYNMLSGKHVPASEEKLQTSKQVQEALVEELNKVDITPQMAWLMQVGSTIRAINVSGCKTTPEMDKAYSELCTKITDYRKRNTSNIPEALTEMYKTGYFKR